MKKFRVTLPIDLGDGVVHQYGEIVELTAEQAVDYSHALIACKDEELTEGE